MDGIFLAVWFAVTFGLSLLAKLPLDEPDAVLFLLFRVIGSVGGLATIMTLVVHDVVMLILAVRAILQEAKPQPKPAPGGEA